MGEESAGMMGNNLRVVSSEGCFATKPVGRDKALECNKAASEEGWGNVWLYI